MLPSAIGTASAPGTIFLPRLDGRPAHSPADASPSTSRPPTQGSGPMRIATPSSCRTFTDYSLPVSRRSPIGNRLAVPCAKNWLSPGLQTSTASSTRCCDEWNKLVDRPRRIMSIDGANGPTRNSESWYNSSIGGISATASQRAPMATSPSRLNELSFQRGPEGYFTLLVDTEMYSQ